MVVANAGVMESHMTLDIETVDINGDLLEATEASKVIDVNVKGTLNSKFRNPLFAASCYLTPCSIEIGSPFHEGQRRALPRWVKGLHCPRHLHIRICWRHWCRSICFFQACHHGLAAVISTRGSAAQH